MTGVAFVGCGYVADYYAKTLGAHRNLELTGVADIDVARAKRFATHHDVEAYRTYRELLDDPRVEIVANLTDPRSHFEVSEAALLAGKHVYSEKPLAMRLDQAKRLVEIAELQGRTLSSAPCSLLGESAQTMWRAVRDRRVGQVRLVYAEMDEGLVHRMPHASWLSDSGAPWPYRDEFELGTVVEHAGYVLTWLPAMFGPATTITGFADRLIPVKSGIATDGTDFAVAAIRFTSGVVARLTCSLIAPHDHSLKVVGDEGVLSIADTWFYDSPVHVRRSINLGRRHQWLPRRRIRLLGEPRRYRYRGAQQMDFARGLAEMAEAIDEGRTPRLSADFCLHATEMVLAVSTALRECSTYRMTTTFEPVRPMTWAT